MTNIASIEPDRELRDALDGHINVGSGSSAKPVTVYSDWERPTNELPDDFIVIYINGDIEGVGMESDFAKGYLMLSLYCLLNNDGSVKRNRIKKLLKKIDEVIKGHIATTNYYYEYDPSRFITPTTPNQNSGYSVTTLNIRWHTTENFNKK